MGVACRHVYVYTAYYLCMYLCKSAYVWFIGYVCICMYLSIINTRLGNNNIMKHKTVIYIVGWVLLSGWYLLKGPSVYLWSKFHCRLMADTVMCTRTVDWRALSKPDAGCPGGVPDFKAAQCCIHMLDAQTPIRHILCSNNIRITSYTTHICISVYLCVYLHVTVYKYLCICVHASLCVCVLTCTCVWV